jgi:hypothetical protein
MILHRFFGEFNSGQFSMSLIFKMNRFADGLARLSETVSMVLLAVCLSSLCVAQDSPTQLRAVQIPELVARLGSSEFSVRESAMEQLARADEKLLPELELALKTLSNEDLEAKVRLNSIVVRVKSDRFRNQEKDFIRSKEATETFGFDGWKSFSKISGTNRNAKLLFLGLLESYPELVYQEIGSQKEALERARDIAATINQKFSDLSGYEVPDALAMLYCFNVAGDLTDRTLERISVRTFYTSPFGPEMQDPQKRKSLEPLLAGWSKHLVDRLPECLMLFTERDYPQARDIAFRLLESDQIKSEPLWYVRSMQAIFRFGSKEDLPRIEKWLDDKTVCVQFPDQGFGNPQPPNLSPTTEFRDIALLVSMQLAGEDFSSTFPDFRPLGIWGFREESTLLKAGSDAIRTSRIEAWKAKRKNPNRS